MNARQQSTRKRLAKIAVAVARFATAAVRTAARKSGNLFRRSGLWQP